MLPVPKLHDCSFISGIRNELKTAQALQAENASRTNDTLRLPKSLVAASENASVRVPEFKLRSAVRTGVRLRVKPAVGRIMVFAIASVTHHKLPHRRVGPIVWQSFDDREARAAIRAIGKRIPIASIARIKGFAKTVRASRNVGQDEHRLFTAFVAVADLEVLCGPPDREWRTPDFG